SHPTVLYRWSDTSSAAEGTYDWYVEVLERARREATLPDEKRMVDRGIRAVAAADAVVRAYGEARAGRMWQARRMAVRGLRGGELRIAARALALVVAPKRT